MSGVLLLDEPQSYLLGSRGLVYAGRRACMLYPYPISITRGKGERWEGPGSEIRGPAAWQMHFFKRNGFFVVVFKGISWTNGEPFVVFFYFFKNWCDGLGDWGLCDLGECEGIGKGQRKAQAKNKAVLCIITLQIKVCHISSKRKPPPP